MLASSYLIYNKKRTFNMIISVVFAVLLLFIISLIFSSIHNYMTETIELQNPYHVSFKADNFKKLNFVQKQKYENGIIYIKYKSIYKVYKNTDLICSKVKCKKITYNEKLLSLYGMSKKSNVMKSFKIMLIVLLVILGIGVYIFLSNIFRISIIYRKKQIGVLKSIGMTKFLIIKNSLLENTIVLIIGFIIGFFLSLWLTQVFLTVLNFLLKDIFTIKLKLVIYPLFILISLIFIIIIFYLSSLMPIIKVNKLSIIETLNGYGNFSKKVSFKYLKKLKPLFKIIVFNYCRNKKNYKAIKLCVFVSVVLYVSFSVSLKYGLVLMNDHIKIPNYDFEIMSIYDENVYKKLHKLGGKYKKYKIYKMCNLDKVVVVDYQKEGLVNAKELQINDKKVKRQITKLPFGVEGLLKTNQKIFLTNNFNDYCSNYNLIMFIKGNSKAIIKDFFKIKFNSIVSYVDVGKVSRLTKNLILVIKISLYSILIVVILISVFLISNTMSLSMELRAKQIGIFKSVGFTDKKIKKMILLEIVMILFKTFIYIFPFSILISYFLFWNITEINKIILPTNELLYSFIFIFLIFYLSLTFNYLKIKRRKITDMIYKDNI